MKRKHDNINSANLKLKAKKMTVSPARNAKVVDPTSTQKRKKASTLVKNDLIKVGGKARNERDKAIHVALSIFKEAWVAFAIDRDIGNADRETREDNAAAKREAALNTDYRKIKAAVLKLLPWIGGLRPGGSKQCEYQVVEFKGQKTPAHLEGRIAHMKMPDKKLAARLLHLRKHPRFHALEAFCALLATISARKERHWLEPFGCLEDIEWRLKKKPGCKSKNSARRREAIREYIETECTRSSGSFATYLVKSSATIRTSFALRNDLLVPASLIIYEHCTLFDALGDPHGEDGDAPLSAEAKSLEWCKKPGTQFAFQDANLEEEEKPSNRNYRMPVKDLQPDAKLRDLLLSKTRCVYLEVVASLAPRDVAKKQGLSEVVKAELTKLMRDAKRRGEAVIMAMGGDEPHTLAQKVYMRKPISDYGLRCGYLRWRASADLPWRREKAYEDRTCLCLQMP
jgi:hypothetical protein